MSYIERNKDLDLEISSPTLNLANGQSNQMEGASYFNNLAGGQGKVLDGRRQLFRFGLQGALSFSAFLMAYHFRYGLAGPEQALYAPVPFEQYLSIGFLYTVILSAMLLLKQYYTASHRRTPGRDLLLLGNAALTSTAAVTFLMLIMLPDLQFSRLLLIYLVPLTWIILGAERLLDWRFQQIRWRKGQGLRNVLVVGATDDSMRLMRTFAEKKGLGYNLVGFVDDQKRYSDWVLPARYGSSIKLDNREVPHLGSTTGLNSLISDHQVNEVIIALPMDQFKTVDNVMRLCQENGINYTLIPSLIDSRANNQSYSVRQINGVPLIVTDRVPLTRLSNVFKRGVDILGALALLVAASIPMLAIAIIIKLDSRGPVIYRQTRVGKHNKSFTFYKFRSMYVNADERLAELEKFNETNGATFKMKKDPRVTRIGRFIRRTSLDELPQIFNVLKGEMSLVGPRPGLPREVMRYQPWQFRRLEVTPGLTGLWQVSGRSNISFEDMVKLDIYYVEHWSPWMDLKILLKTFSVVVRAEGAY